LDNCAIGNVLFAPVFMHCTITACFNLVFVAMSIKLNLRSALPSSPSSEVATAKSSARVFYRASDVPLKMRLERLVMLSLYTTLIDPWHR